MKIFQHSDDRYVGACLSEAFKVLTFIKYISLGLRLQSLELYRSYICTNSLQHSIYKGKLEIASYDPFNAYGEIE